MDTFWKAAGIAILTVILGVTIGKTEKDMAAVLSVVACCTILGIAIRYLSEVFIFLWKLVNSMDFSDQNVHSLVKICAVALITEITGLISNDAGNSSLGKAMQILGNAAILFLALPMFESLFSILQKMTGVL